MLYQVAEDLRAFKSTLRTKTEKGSKISNKAFPKKDQTKIVMKKVNSVGFMYHNFSRVPYKYPHLSELFCAHFTISEGQNCSQPLLEHLL